MSIFNKLGIDNFNEKITSPGEDIPGLQFVIDCGLVPADTAKACSKCNSSMILRKSHHSVLGKSYICRNDECRKQENWAKGTIFEGSKLSVLKILKIIFFWCSRETISKTARYLVITEQSVERYFKILRDMCIKVMEINESTQKIGGEGKVVEIDETMIYTRKNNKGRLTANEKEQVWVFGGIERESKLFFAEIVKKRDTSTLLKVLKKNVLPETTIYSDQWAAYRCLKWHFFEHDTVNHKENFVNPFCSEVHTQTIERRWRFLKENLPKSSHGEHRDDHLIVFCYRSKYYTLNQDGLNFEKTLNHLKSFFSK